jgi:hypothetical protein
VEGSSGFAEIRNGLIRILRNYSLPQADIYFLPATEKTPRL